MERLSPAAGHDSAPLYEETVLYAVVQSELETFLARGREPGQIPPQVGSHDAEIAASPLACP
jgi:hypothetical protein